VGVPDYYNVLGVSESATQDDISKAFRSLAKKYHPDTHHGDAEAETRFKEVSEAHETLSDPDKRKQYDALRAAARSGFGGYRAGPGGVRFEEFDLSGLGGAGGSFDDILSQLFGGLRGSPRGARTRPSKGANVTAIIRVPFKVAVRGGKTRLAFSQGGNTRTIDLSVPAGTEDGGRIRLRGLGSPGPAGPGDLVVTVRVDKNAHFRRDGFDIEGSFDVPFTTAALGGKVRAKSLDGEVELTIPPGTSGGKRFRLRGQGVKSKNGTGDLYLTVNVVIPEKLTKQQRRRLEELAQEIEKEKKG
jgi:molecular chaperone DnaJ